jgi:RNA recognition motif-containing protein
MAQVQVLIANIPSGVTSSELSRLLSPVVSGASAHVATDSATGRSRGFAIVEVGSEAEAREIVRKFSGYMLGGKRLRVELTGRPPQRREYGRRFRPPSQAQRRPGPPRRPERSPGR